MKKHFQILGMLTLIWFSFFCTEKTSLVIKNNDEIMVMINQEKDKYNIESIDSIIYDNTIIPGSSGIIVNVEESYKRMKRLGSYNPSLFVYDKLKPNISIYDNYDKFIVSGNKKNRSISIIFKISDIETLKKTISLLENNNISGNFLYENNNEILYKELYNLENKYDILVTLPTLDSKFKSNIYCYNTNKDFDFLELCISKKYFSILPVIEIENNIYLKIKENAIPGLIVSINVNQYSLKEVQTSIDYLKSRGYQILSLSELIKE